MFSDELEILEYQHRLRPDQDTWACEAACPVCGLIENCQCDTVALTATAPAHYED